MPAPPCCKVSFLVLAAGLASTSAPATSVVHADDAPPITVNVESTPVGGFSGSGQFDIELALVVEQDNVAQSSDDGHEQQAQGGDDGTPEQAHDDGAAEKSGEGQQRSSQSRRIIIRRKATAGAAPGQQETQVLEFSGDALDPQDLEALLRQAHQGAGGPQGFTFSTAGPSGAGPKFIIGVSASEAPAVLWKQLGRSDGSGVVIDTIMKDSPAAKAGLQELDVILAVGDASVRNTDTLIESVQKAGTNPVTLRILRDGHELSLDVTPHESSRPQAAQLLLELAQNDGRPKGLNLVDATVTSVGPGVWVGAIQSPNSATPGAAQDAELSRQIEQLRQEVGELRKLLEELKSDK